MFLLWSLGFFLWLSSICFRADGSISGLNSVSVVFIAEGRRVKCLSISGKCFFCKILLFLFKVRLL